MHQNKFEHLTMCQNKLEHLTEFVLYLCFRGFLKKWKKYEEFKTFLMNNRKLFDEEICWEDSSGAEEEVAPWW